MENIKINLRSVLLSKVGGVPLKNVEKDYKNLVGERLNWRQFGFGSFEAFLNDIPDVVKVAFKKDAMHAFGVAENMSYINPTARKAQFKEPQPKNGTYSTTGKMTVYFGNLPLNVTEETLKSFLSGYLVMEIKTAKQSGLTNAWVTTSAESGQSMCSELNKKRYGDRILKVEPARIKNGEKKQDNPAQPSSSRSYAASVRSDGDSSSLRTQSSKNNSAAESLNSTNTWSKRNGVGEPQLRREVAAEPCQQRKSRPDVANSDPAFALEATASNYGVKDSTNVSEIGQFKNSADYGPDSDFLWNDSSEPPPLVEESDWAEFESGISSKCFNSQRGHSSQTCDEPPPLFSRDEFEKQQKNEIFSSANRPLNAVPNNEKLYHNPYEEETFNLYVRNIPWGTTSAELSQLFKNSIKIVELPRQCCFAVFNTFEEVEDASRRSWMIRGAPIFVDVATKYKHLSSEPERFIQSSRNGGQDQVVDLSTGFENLTCTVGSNNERTVQLCGEKKPTENKSNVSRSQTTNNSNIRENIQQRSQPMTDMPPLVSKADDTNSRVNPQPATDKVIPPLLSMEELAKFRESQAPPPSQKALMLAKLCNAETTEWDFPESARNDANFKQPCGDLNSQETLQARARKTVSSKQFHDFDEDYQASNRNSVPPSKQNESNSQQYFPKSSQALPSAKQGNSSEMQDSSHVSVRKVMPALKQHNRPNSGTKFQPSSGASESGGLDERGCTASLSSQLPIATASSQSAASLSPLKPIPDEMRLKELQRMLVDTFPGDTLPMSYLLPEVIDVIIICAVPGFENSFFWGQVASEPFESELQKMYDLIPRMERLSGSLTVASAALRRGAARYGEDWCRVWIKQREETVSTVFFIDFGNFETVSNDNIYELPEDFWKVRPTALPFRILDSGKLNIAEYVNKRVTAKVNKKCQRGCIFEIYDLQAQS